MKAIFLSILMIHHFGLFAQHGRFINDTVRVLELKETELTSILDSFIELEKNCGYYSPNLVLGIHFQSWKDGHFVTVSSGKELSGDIENDLIYGGFKYKAHYVEVSSSCEFIVKDFFRETDEVKVVNRYIPFNGRHPKTGGIIIESEEDDSFSFWRYFYSGAELKLHERHSYCY